MLHLSRPTLNAALGKRRFVLALFFLTFALSSSMWRNLPAGTGRAQNTSAQSERGRTEINVAAGLQRIIFTTPMGSKIYVSLPTDLIPGATYSGTIIIETSDKDDAESTARTDELRNYVVEFDGQKIPASEKTFELELPAAPAQRMMRVVLRDGEDNAIAQAEVSFVPQELPRPSKTEFPSYGQKGGLIEISCSCDGVIAASDYVKVGGKDILILSESPRKKVALNTSDSQDATQIEVGERGQITSGEMSILDIKLAMGKQNLLRGEQTTLVLEVTGLEDLREDLPLHLENRTPNTLTMESADVQEIKIKPAEVQPGGRYATQRTLTGLQVGASFIVATVSGRDKSTPLAEGRVAANSVFDEAGRPNQAAPKTGSSPFLTPQFEISPVPRFSKACTNGNVEAGNFKSWTGYSGSYPTGDSSLTPGIIGNRHTIMSGTGTDPYGGFPVVQSGSYSIRIGNTTTGAQADMVSYSFLVTPANKNFQFKYAVVLQDPQHASAEQPDFIYYMKTENTPGLPTAGSQPPNYLLFNATYTRVVANVNDPFFKISSSDPGVVYKSWFCVGFDLTPWLGQVVTIFFKVRDCALGGHWGYAYIDSLCNTDTPHADFTLPQNFCNTAAGLPVDASASTDEDSYQWTVYETDATGGTINVPTRVSETFYGTAGSLDIQQWYQQHGQEFKCNKYYRVTLTVTNQCGESDEESRLVQHYCPQADAGPDKFVCCGQRLLATTIGSAPQGNNTYSWTSSPAGFTSNLAQPTVILTQPTTYQLTVTDPNGCRATDTVNVSVLRPFNAAIEYTCLKNFTGVPPDCPADVSQPKPSPCAATLKAVVTYLDCPKAIPSADSALTYRWSTGETTPEITAHPGITSYSVTVSNGCFSKTATISNAILDGNYFSAPIPTIAAPNAIVPNGTSGQKVVNFIEYGASAPALGTGPAYHAYRYRLRVYDRWGNRIYCKEEFNSCGFVNGHIQWDGRNSFGNLVPTAVYTAQLTLWSCSTPLTGTKNFSVNRGRHLECSGYHWVWFPWPHRECDGYHWVYDYESAATCHITVFYN